MPSVRRGAHVGTRAEIDLLDLLTAKAQGLLAEAFAPGSKGVLQSALRAFARFSKSTPSRALFYTHEHAPGSMNEHGMRAWNEWTLVLFAIYLATVNSQKTGKPVCSDTVSTYVSMVKGFLSFKYAFTLVKESPRLARLLKAMRSKDPMHGIRRKRRGLRRRHLRRAWKRKAELRSTQQDAVNKWAAITVAWHCLARGGELTTQLPTRADLTFGTPTSGRRWACLMLKPLKKRGKGAAPKVPQFIEEFDGGGSDTYAALARLEEWDPIQGPERATTPLFRLHRLTKKGTRSKEKAPHAMKAAEFRAFVKYLGAKVLKLGESKQWGAHSPRVGGATDLCATGKSSAVLLQAKGRWASDIGKIYARMTWRMQLAASRLMQTARGRDIEELMPEFTQQA